MSTIYDLAEAEREHLAYLATLEEEPEGRDDMGWHELERRLHDDVTGWNLDGVRITRGTVHATKLC